MPPRSHAQGQVVAKINGARKNRQEQQGSKRKQARKGLRTSSTLAEMALDLVKCVYCMLRSRIAPPAPNSSNWRHATSPWRYGGIFGHPTDASYLSMPLRWTL